MSAPGPEPRPVDPAGVKGGVTVWLTADQLDPCVSALEGVSPREGVVLLIESLARSRQLPYHKQKLVLLWSAMRHFSRELSRLGYRVDYHEAAPDFETALKRHVKRFRPSRLRLMRSAEYGASESLADLARTQGLELEITPNNMFVSDGEAFAAWARGKKTLRLETFYRRMRRQTGLLMRDGEPQGDRWNFDADNRSVPPAGHVFPAIPCFEPDAITRRVMRLVRREFPDHFGELDEFAWPVTRADAQSFFQDFLEQRLDRFGPYEDAIVAGERALYHSLVSPLLNIGLLRPLELARSAEERFRQGRARLNSAEGFVRQVIGWREFVYRIYRLKMPGYTRLNFFEADLPLPDFYWTAETAMACCADALHLLRRHGINHHIQRLMITGNFALIAGIEPQAVNRWYWLAYADAYEWVVSPNVLGLTLYADGGLLATKPYAASANYINKMSDCCRGCRYTPRQTTGADACPFNALYWDFLARNRRRLGRNPRMNMVLGLLARRGRGELKDIRSRAETIRSRLAAGGSV